MIIAQMPSLKTNLVNEGVINQDKYHLKLQSLPTTGVTAREFCRTFFEINHLSPEVISEYETQTGYRCECIKLLAKVLDVSPCSVRKWGSDLNFSKMPHSYRLSLAYALKAGLGMRAEEE